MPWIHIVNTAEYYSNYLHYFTGGNPILSYLHDVAVPLCDRTGVMNRE